MCTYRYLLVAITVSLVLLSSGCKRFAAKLGVTYVRFADVSGEKDVASGVRNLEVDIRVGEVKVVAGESGRLRIEATVRIKESLANPAADPGGFSDHVRVTTDGDTITVADAHTGRPDEKDWRVSLVVHAPADLAVNLHTSAGRVVVDGMTSDIKAKSDAGEVLIRTSTPNAVTVSTAAGKIDITLEGVTGPVTASTSAGSINMTVTKTPPVKDVVLTVAVGEVVLTIPPGAPGTFDLSVDIGQVSVKGHDGITVKRVALGATGKGTIGEGGPTYKLEAATGSVTVR